MHKRTRGSSIVEFALLCPLITAILAGLLFVAQLGIRHVVLTHEAIRLARRLSVSPNENIAALVAARFRTPTTVHVVRRELLVDRAVLPPRPVRHIGVINVTLEQTVQFLGWTRTLAGRATEPCVLVGS